MNKFLIIGASASALIASVVCASILPPTLHRTSADDLPSPVRLESPGLAGGRPGAVPEGPGQWGSSEDTTFYQEVSWSPDGASLSVSRLDIHLAYRSSIAVMDADGSGYVELAGGSDDRWTSWSPDGDRIVFASSRSGNADVYAIGVDGSGLVRLTSAESSDTHPDWSPDGSRIVFVSDRAGPSDIFVIRADGTDPQRITRSDAEEWNPRWSPDGSRIAYFATAPTGEDSVYVMNADGSAITAVSAGIWPSWSPDGGSLLYSVDHDIYSISLESMETKKILPDSYFASWSPDGMQIAFLRTTWRAPEGWPSMSEVFRVRYDGTMEIQVTGSSKR